MSGDNSNNNSNSIIADSNTNLLNNSSAMVNVQNNNLNGIYPTVENQNQVISETVPVQPVLQVPRVSSPINHESPASPLSPQNPINPQQSPISGYYTTQGSVQYPKPNGQNGTELNPPSYEQTMNTSAIVGSGNGVIPPPSQQPFPNNNPETVVLMINENQIPRVSAKMKCPNCDRTVDTVVRYEDNVLVWGLCIILFIFTCLCCIPFCINDIKDAVHYCPICKKEIARKERVI